MLRRLTIILAALALAGLAAAATTSTCPQPFPLVGLAPWYLDFPLHGHVHTVTIAQHATPKTDRPMAYRLTFTPQGQLAAADSFVGTRHALSYRTTFTPDGRPDTQTFTFMGRGLVKIKWSYTVDAPDGYGAMYVADSTDGPIPSAPNFAIRRNYLLWDYVIVAPGNGIEGSISYKQAADCSLKELMINLPTSEQQYPMLIALSGKLFTDYDATTYTFDALPQSDHLVVIQDRDHPTTDYSHNAAVHALSLDEFGNATSIVFGAPTNQGDHWALTPGPNQAVLDLAYTYY